MGKPSLWIGGATLATLALFGGVSIAATMLARGEQALPPAPAITVEDAIPIDREAFVEGERAREDGEAALAALTEETVPGLGDTDQTDQGEDGEATDEAQATPAQAAAPSVRQATRQPAAQREPLVVKRILPIDGPIRYGEWFWDEKGVPPGGEIVMTVDLDARVISVFRGGYEIGAAAVLLGTQTHPTPLGTFPILYKMRHNVSEKYNNAPMPYSMFLTRDGIALHGSQVENGYASHGCVGMPDEFAAKVFGVAKKGDRVIITRGETLSMGEQIL